MASIFIQRHFEAERWAQASPRALICSELQKALKYIAENSIGIYTSHNMQSNDDCSGIKIVNYFNLVTKVLSDVVNKLGAQLWYIGRGDSVVG